MSLDFSFYCVSSLSTCFHTYSPSSPHCLTSPHHSAVPRHTSRAPTQTDSQRQAKKGGRRGGGGRSELAFVIALHNMQAVTSLELGGAQAKIALLPFKVNVGVGVGGVTVCKDDGW